MNVLTKSKKAKVEIRIRPFNSLETKRKCAHCLNGASYFMFRMALGNQGIDNSSKRPVCVEHSGEWLG